MIAMFFSASLLTFVGEDPSWKHVSVSAYAIDTVTGEVLLDEGSDKSLVPASCVKVITTAAALQILGGDFRFVTDLEYDGEISKEGVLRGNLYIRGGGDPCLGSGRGGKSLPWQELLAVWAKAVKEAGIVQVAGDVIGDDSLWGKNHVPPSWSWEDMGNYYGAVSSALAFHENSCDLVLSPGRKEGDLVEIVRVEPEVKGLVMQNLLKTGPQGSGDLACVYAAPFSSHLQVEGTVPLGEREFRIRAAAQKPAQFCSDALVRTLKKEGVDVSGAIFASLSSRKRLMRTESPSLAEIVFMTNQESVNLYAEHLLREMGKGSCELGRRAIFKFLQDLGVSKEGLHLEDGSGLSRKNLVSAKHFVALLKKIKELPIYSTFRHSLREIKSGVVAKSGSMSFVQGYVGYAGDVAFAIVINHAIGLNPKEKILNFLPGLIPREKQ